MGQAYTPGLKVTGRTTHRVRRVLPLPGEVLVEVGDDVQPRDVIARAHMPGEITPVNMANQLSVPPGDVKDLMLMKEGDRVAVGDSLAQTKGLFGFGKSTIKSRHEGTIETISDVTGQMIIRGAPIPVETKAYMQGRVVEMIEGEGAIIENEVAFVQGIFGVGGETDGTIRMALPDAAQELKADHITADMKGQVVVGGARVWHEAVQKAIEVGASAIVTGGIDDQDLKQILGTDLGVAITGTEQIGITVIITEGFGDIAMAGRTFELLKSREGRTASVNGATQIRAGVMRPEILIPYSDGDHIASADGGHESGTLAVGRPVRIIRDPYFGLLGEVADLPAEPHVLGSGSKARVLEVKAGDGTTVTVPRANVELIEG